MDYERTGGIDPAKATVGDGSVDLLGNPAIKSKTGGWKATSFIHALLAADTMTMPGLAGNIQPYLALTLHESIAESSNTVSNVMGVTYLLPLFWGYVADSYIGKFKTIVVGSIICILGWTVLLISASLPSLKPASCTPTAVCSRASSHIINWFNAGLFMVSVGSSALKPCMAAMAMDQFDKTDPVEKKRGEPFFSSYYWNLSATAIFVSTVIVSIQSNVGYDWGFGVEAGLAWLLVALFFSGTIFLRHSKPAGSGLSRLAEVLVVAMKNARKPLPSNIASQLYETAYFMPTGIQSPNLATQTD
ncbi:unnamed protein product [Calypogeia fissa]